MWTIDRSPATESKTGAVGWAVMGASRVARQWMIDAIRQQPAETKSWIVGLYSHNSSRGQQFADEMHLARAYDSVDSLLWRSDVQCVYVSSHPRHQIEMAARAVEAGKHVLCETPLGVEVAEAEELVRMAARRNVLLAVNFALRFDPALATAAQMIRNHEIGNLLGGQINFTRPLPLEQQTWRLDARGGGVLLDRTVHDVDLVRWLFADECAQVMALAGPSTLGRGRRAGGVEEDVSALVHLRRSRLVVRLYDSFNVPHQHNVATVHGTGGTLMAHHWAYPPRRSELLLIRHQEARPVPLPDVNPYHRSVYSFVAALHAHGQGRQIRPEALAVGEDGVRALRAVQAMQPSLRIRKSVDLAGATVDEGN